MRATLIALVFLSACYRHSGADKDAEPRAILTATDLPSDDDPDDPIVTEPTEVDTDRVDTEGFDSDLPPPTDCTDGCGSPGCGRCPDTVLVSVPNGGDVAATEVSNTEYARFLEADFSDADLSAWLPPACAWKSDFTPEDWPSALPDAKPVTGVDWCDAWAFCDWSGQRLCGAVEGGSVSLANFRDPTTNQWYRACSQGGASAYPYGDTFRATACNGVDAGLGVPADVGTTSGCEGGYPGLYDLSGNVWEWEDACDATTSIAPRDQECRRRGGSWFSDASTLRCELDSVRPRSYRASSQGIRCCARP